MSIKKISFLLLSIVLGILLFIGSLWSSIPGVILLIIMNLLYFKNLKGEKLHLLPEDLMYDPITGLVSSVYFRHHLMEDFQRAKRTNKPLSILIFDIDHFKEINMNLGFRFGDLILKEVAQLANACIRTSDVFSYFGGDEFAIILTDTDLSTGKKIGERIINKLTSSPITVSVDNRKEKIHFTISMGGSTLTSNMETPLDLLDKARQNLERAKRQGGNNFIFE